MDEVKGAGSAVPVGQLSETISPQTAIDGEEALLDEFVLASDYSFDAFDHSDANLAQVGLQAQLEAGLEAHDEVATAIFESISIYGADATVLALRELRDDYGPVLADFPEAAVYGMTTYLVAELGREVGIHQSLYALEEMRGDGDLTLEEQELVQRVAAAWTTDASRQVEALRTDPSAQQKNPNVINEGLKLPLGAARSDYLGLDAVNADRAEQELKLFLDGYQADQDVDQLGLYSKLADLIDKHGADAVTLAVRQLEGNDDYKAILGDIPEASLYAMAVHLNGLEGKEAGLVQGFTYLKDGNIEPFRAFSQDELKALAASLNASNTDQYLELATIPLEAGLFFETYREVLLSPEIAAIVDPDPLMPAEFQPKVSGPIPEGVTMIYRPEEKGLPGDLAADYAAATAKGRTDVVAVNVFQFTPPGSETSYYAMVDNVAVAGVTIPQFMVYDGAGNRLGL
jgi:hypothetical protein